jgi:hypothetical protein
MIRYTVRSNPILARIQPVFNGRILDQCRRKLNEAPTEAEGREAVRAYLRTLFREGYKYRADEIVDGTTSSEKGR